MARQLRVEFPGAIYHVTVRMLGNWKKEKNALFEDDVDRERLLLSLAERVEQHQIRLYLYCLMTNHIHLVFETPEGNCSKFMHALSTAYTVYFNLRHERHGHLFDGRYKAKLVEGDEYLLALSRYVHLNPVRVGKMQNKPLSERVGYLRRYPWSSYTSYIGQRKALDFVEYGPVLAEMGGRQAQRPRRYRNFVETGLAEDDEDFQVALKESPRCIGGEAFRGWVDEFYQKIIEGHRVPEDVAFRHTTEPLPVDVILKTVAEVLKVDVGALLKRRRNSPLRAVAARMLIRFGGQSQRQAALHLGLGTGGAVSAQVRRLPDLLAEHQRLRRSVKRIERTLDALKQNKPHPSMAKNTKKC